MYQYYVFATSCYGWNCTILRGGREFGARFVRLEWRRVNHAD